MKARIYLFVLSLAVIFHPSPSGAGQCDFLPEEPAPKWVASGYSLPGYYVGVGVAEKKKTADDMLDASRLDALKSISMSITVTVSGTVSDVLKSSSAGGVSVTEQEVEAATESSVQETLRDMEVRDKWLDRPNCRLWTLAVVSEESVEKVRQETAERLKKKFTSKKAMIFPAAGGSPSMDGRVKANLEKLLRDLGMEVLAADAKYSDCANPGAGGVCKDMANTVFGVFKADFTEEKLSKDGKKKARFYRFSLSLYLKDAKISSFSDVECRGVGDASKSGDELDLLTADACVEKISKKLATDMQGSER